MIIFNYSHLSPQLQLNLIKLLIYIDGLDAIRNYKNTVDRILKDL